MLRSPLSRVPQGVAGAYAALAAREGPVLSLIERQRFACDGEARERILDFASALNELAADAAADDDAVGQAAARRFSLTESGIETRVATPDRFALCEPVSPEAPSGVRTHNPRFSASQLNTYVECPRKWFFRYLCAAIEDKGSSASFYGTAFHAALEAFHGEFPEPANVPVRQMQLKLEGYVNSSFDRHRNNFETPVEHELQRRRAIRTARKYVEWLAAQAQRAPFTVIGCELGAELQIDGYDFIGYIDRLDRDDSTGATSVIDYKTGSIATTAAEYRDKVREFKDFQLPFYYWARTAQGDRVARLALVPLKDALADVRPIALEVVPVAADAAPSKSANGVIPIAELERARTRMVEICRELTSGETSRFEVTSDPSACTYCAYAAACEHRPYPIEERFGR